ncbi:MAG: dTDP-4-amino-4,6-dideoxygalactose transaminase, partial [Planctomycetaceae bacterium]|nr:dTDP-4-amino-4,6-dideoxygalactose transaminase [Planctomycetaceae bacterium]
MDYVIPFNKPFRSGNELDYVSQAVTAGDISGDGEFTKRCSTLLETQFGIKKILLTPSCTAALEMSIMILGIGAGDEVIMPSFTFV